MFIFRLKKSLHSKIPKIITCISFHSSVGQTSAEAKFNLYSFNPVKAGDPRAETEAAPRRFGSRDAIWRLRASPPLMLEEFARDL
ncbi:hypothetical protein NL676_012600 [Syzygium grande]|nr:hypothetical protein NL676_012600 [Syzygium grande]